MNLSRISGYARVLRYESLAQNKFRTERVNTISSLRDRRSEEEHEEATRATEGEEGGKGPSRLTGENVTGNARAVARLELRLSRNEGWRTENEDRNGPTLGRGREVREGGAPVENARRRRRPFPADGWNRASPMAPMTVDALLSFRRQPRSRSPRARSSTGKRNRRNPADVAANGARREERPVFHEETSVVRHHRRLRENRIHERARATCAAEIL